MSYAARLVLRAIDQAEQTRIRNPVLFHAQMRNDRSCLQLARAVDRYKREKPKVTTRPDHDLEVERVDQAWEEQEARRREERFSKRRLSQDAERREQLAVMDTLSKHRWAIERAAKLSTVAAGSVAPSRGGDEPIGPPGQQLLDDDPAWSEHWTVIDSRLDRVHEKLDEAERGTVATIASMTGVEKDKLICDPSNRGLRAQGVVDKLGSDIAGSAETVRRVRRARGLDHLGHEKAESTV